MLLYPLPSYLEMIEITKTWGMPARRLIIEDLLKALPDEEQRYVLEHLVGELESKGISIHRDAK